MTPIREQAEQRSGPRRIMAYCHDSVGIGHLRRTLAICQHLGGIYPECSFLMLTGTPYVPLFSGAARVDTIKLPALAKSGDGAYGAKFMNVSAERIMRCRESILLHAAEEYEPDVLLVDKAPLGVCRELVPTLRWLREHRPEVRIIFGMRDVEDDADATLRQWNRDGVPQALEELFDEIWVYGMQSVYDAVREYRLGPSIERKLRYVGYIGRPECGHTPPQHSGRDILVTVGGGTDGEFLLSAYLEQAASAAAELGFRSTIVGGPDLPEEAAYRLRERASALPNVRWPDFEACMTCRMRESSLVVCMGGYNTMCELATLRKPALIIPRIKPRLEQKIRAQLWERLGVVSMLDPVGLTAENLSRRVVELLADGPSSPRGRIEMRGLANVAERFAELFPATTCDEPATRVGVAL